MRRAHHNSASNGHCGTHVLERLPERLAVVPEVRSTAPGGRSASKVAERRRLPRWGCEEGRGEAGRLACMGGRSDKSVLSAPFIRWTVTPPTPSPPGSQNRTEVAN